MNWKPSNDHMPRVITAERHINSRHVGRDIRLLPRTCVIFEMGMALRFIESSFQAVTLMERLPCFLEGSKCISIKGNEHVCFTRGGYGAPAAVDTLETVRALGVQRMIAVGMCGSFAENIPVGGVIVPDKILCEEGTSLHYFEHMEYAEPDMEPCRRARTYFSGAFQVFESPAVRTASI